MCWETGWRSAGAHLHGGVHHARAGAVVEVDVGHLHALGEGRRVDGEVVVLCADLYPPCAAAEYVGLLEAMGVCAH
jgi:hypothetical protein